MNISSLSNFVLDNIDDNMPQNDIYPPEKTVKRRRKKDKPVSHACIICSHDHASCDDSMCYIIITNDCVCYP